MSRRAEDLIEEVRSLPQREQLRLVERVIHDLTGEDIQDAVAPVVIGAFADQADLVEKITEEAMQARARDPLRQPGA